ncbi:hypothetical protein OAO18_06440 [Francisellaceae bacterium]|nr:hypothetical protein [Francisellaceae bacterium]
MSILTLNEKQFQNKVSNITSKARQNLVEDIPHLNWSRKQILAHQQYQIRKILTHAKNHSPYYQQVLKNTDVENATIETLNEIPYLTKQMVLENWDNIVCDRSVTKAQAESHLEDIRRGKVNNPIFKDKYFIFATGGSSGQRGIFLWDDEFIAANLSFVFRGNTYYEKNWILDEKRCALLSAPGMLHASTYLFGLQPDEKMKVFHVPVDQTIDDMVKQVNEIQPTHMIGFSSAVNILAQEAKKGKLICQPLRINTNSEPLDEETRNIVREVWGIEINNGWGSVKTGLIAHEDDTFNGLNMAEDYYTFATVDDDFKATSNPNEISKVLVTNTLNYTFPLINYVLDDVLEIQPSSKECAYQKIKAIKGRSDDWFIYNGVKLHPITFRDALGQFKAINEYQVEQISSGIIVRLVCEQLIKLDELKQMILNNVAKYGLHDFDVKIEKFDKLPRHKETGKVKRFISLK